MKQSNPGQSRSRGGAGQVILGIVGGLVVLVLVVVLVTVWAVRNFVSVEVNDSDGSTRVQIATPFGEMIVSDAAVLAEDLGLPLYPDAEAEGDAGTFRLRGHMGDEVEGITVRGAEFRARASLEDVDEWYRRQLGSEYRRYEGDDLHVLKNKDWPGDFYVNFDSDSIVYLYETRAFTRGVVLEPHGSRLQVGLFELTHDRPL